MCVCVFVYRGRYVRWLWKRVWCKEQGGLDWIIEHMTTPRYVTHQSDLAKLSICICTFAVDKHILFYWVLLMDRMIYILIVYQKNSVQKKFTDVWNLEEPIFFKQAAILTELWCYCSYSIITSGWYINQNRTKNTSTDILSMTEEVVKG